MADANDKTFLGTGWSFPPEFDPISSTVKLISDEEDIKSSLEILLSTAIGERVMLPEYGCSLKQFLFEPLDTSLQSYIKEIVRSAILNFETRIKLDDLQITANADEGMFELLLTYIIKSTNSRDNFVYPFYKTEGTNI
jgi:phage baseplate assembly protein W